MYTCSYFIHGYSFLLSRFVVVYEKSGDVPTMYAFRMKAEDRYSDVRTAVSTKSCIARDFILLAELNGPHVKVSWLYWRPTT